MTKRQSWRHDFRDIRAGLMPTCESPTFLAAISVMMVRKSRVGFLMQRKLPHDSIAALCLVNERCKAYQIFSTRRILNA